MAVLERSEWCVSMWVAADSGRHTPDHSLSNIAVHCVTRKLQRTGAQLRKKCTQ